MTPVDPLTPDEWADVAAGLAVAYPNRIDVASIIAWYRDVAEYDGNHVLDAIDEIRASGSAHPPSLGQLVTNVRRRAHEQKRREDTVERLRDVDRLRNGSVGLAEYVVAGAPAGRTGDPSGRTATERLALIADLLDRGYIVGAGSLRGNDPVAVEARRILAPFMRTPKALDELSDVPVLRTV